MAKPKRKIKSSCKKCGRPLTDSESLIRGYGPVCFLEMPAVVTKMLEEAGQLRLPGIQ